MRTLDELKRYWTSKYPHAKINLWSNREGNKLFAVLAHQDRQLNLYEETFGQILKHGEDFLRRVN